MWWCHRMGEGEERALWLVPPFGSPLPPKTVPPPFIIFFLSYLLRGCVVCFSMNGLTRTWCVCGGGGGRSQPSEELLLLRQPRKASLAFWKVLAGGKPSAAGPVPLPLPAPGARAPLLFFLSPRPAHPAHPAAPFWSWLGRPAGAA